MRPRQESTIRRWWGSQRTARWRRHTVEVGGVIAALVGLHALGVFPPEVAWWTLPVLVLITGAVVATVYTRFGNHGVQLHLRTAVQTGVLGVVMYASGWGFALPLLELLAVADAIKHAGARATHVVLGWTTVVVVLGQAALAAGLAPSAHPVVGETHGIALFGLGAVAVVALRIRDTSAAKEVAERRLRSSEERFRTLVEDANDVVLVIRDGQVVYVSPSASRVLGYAESEVADTAYLSLVHPDDREQVAVDVERLQATPGATGLIECRMRHRDGQWITMEASCRNLTADDVVEGFVINLRDVTERRQLRAELNHRSLHDRLTGLANRSLFVSRVEHLVARSARSSTTAALLYVNLDSFKTINDAFGHGVGDDALAEIGERLAACTREADTAARLGGDEFALLLEDVDGREGAERVAQRVLDDLRVPLAIDGHRPVVDASIGIALHVPAWSAEELMRNANVAMYVAKRAERSTYVVFQPDMHGSVTDRLRLAADLDLAQDDDQLDLHYQPIVRLHDDQVVGVEALVRWNHPERGSVSPAVFVPIAEDTGQIVRLGAWVLRRACWQTAEWRHRHLPDLHVSVNVSMHQLADPHFVDQVNEALTHSGLPAEALVLELTESALVADRGRAVGMLRQLKELGVQLAIDDFGTGYSSLAYLEQFPVDVLKIDRRFVEGLVRGTHKPALVRAIVELGRSLDLEIVAEGIEEPEELEQVRALECRLGQGYLLAHPADAATTERALGNGHHPEARLTRTRAALPRAPRAAPY